MPDADYDAGRNDPCGAQHPWHGVSQPNAEKDVLRQALAKALREAVYRRPEPFPDSPAEREYLAAADALLGRADLSITYVTPPAEHQARHNLPGNMHPGPQSECRVPSCVLPPDAFAPAVGESVTNSGDERQCVLPPVDGGGQ